MTGDTRTFIVSSPDGNGSKTIELRHYSTLYSNQRGGNKNWENFYKFPNALVAKGWVQLHHFGSIGNDTSKGEGVWECKLPCICGCKRNKICVPLQSTADASSPSRKAKAFKFKESCTLLFQIKPKGDGTVRYTNDGGDDSDGPGYHGKDPNGGQFSGRDLFHPELFCQHIIDNSKIYIGKGKGFYFETQSDFDEFAADFKSGYYQTRIEGWTFDDGDYTDKAGTNYTGHEGFKKYINGLVQKDKELRVKDPLIKEFEPRPKSPKNEGDNNSPKNTSKKTNARNRTKSRSPPALKNTTNTQVSTTPVSSSRNRTINQTVSKRGSKINSSALPVNHEAVKPLPRYPADVADSFLSFDTMTLNSDDYQTPTRVTSHTDNGSISLLDNTGDNIPQAGWSGPGTIVDNDNNINYSDLNFSNNISLTHNFDEPDWTSPFGEQSAFLSSRNNSLFLSTADQSSSSLPGLPNATSSTNVEYVYLSDSSDDEDFPLIRDAVPSKFPTVCSSVNTSIDSLSWVQERKKKRDEEENTTDEKDDARNKEISVSPINT